VAITAFPFNKWQFFRTFCMLLSQKYDKRFIIDV